MGSLGRLGSSASLTKGKRMKHAKDMELSELIVVLRDIADRSTNNEDFREKVREELPGVAATIAKRGRRYMGMAMSHWYKGTIQF